MFLRNACFYALQGATSRNTTFFIVTAVRTAKPVAHLLLQSAHLFMWIAHPDHIPLSDFRFPSGGLKVPLSSQWRLWQSQFNPQVITQNTTRQRIRNSAAISFTLQNPSVSSIKSCSWMTYSCLTCSSIAGVRETEFADWFWGHHFRRFICFANHANNLCSAVMIWFVFY
jgi:hypothetical protein